MKVVARIFLDVTGHMTSQLVLLRWPSSTQYSVRCATDGVRRCSDAVCRHCDERAWIFAVCIYYSTSVVSHYHQQIEIGNGVISVGHFRFVAVLYGIMFHGPGKLSRDLKGNEHLLAIYEKSVNIRMIIYFMPSFLILSLPYLYDAVFRSAVRFCRIWLSKCLPSDNDV
jgi:hypothetical protein